MSTELAAVSIAPPVAKLVYAFSVFRVAPLLVKSPVPADEPTVKPPWTVTVVVVLPMVTAAALPVPIDIVGVPVVKVPVSILILPEAPPEASPLEMVTLLLVVPAEVPTETPFAF